MKNRKILGIFAVLALSQIVGCMSVGQSYAEGQGAKMMKAEGFSDAEIDKFKKANTREGSTELWKQKQSNESDKVKVEGLDSSFAVIDDEYDRWCQLTGDYGALLKVSLNKGAGLLLPVYSLDENGDFKFDKEKTEKLHSNLTKIGLKVLPMSETIKFINIASKYIEKVAISEAKENREKYGRGGILMIGGAISDLSKATTAEIYRTPFNTIDYYTEVMANFPNVSYTIGTGSEETGLSSLKQDIFYKSIGVDVEKSKMQIKGGMTSIDYQYASDETKAVAQLASFYKNQKAQTMSTNNGIKLVPMEEYKNRTATPGMRLKQAGACGVASYSFRMDFFKIQEKQAEEINKVGKQMGLTFLTAGFSNLGQLASAKVSDGDAKAKALQELKVARAEYTEVYSKAEDLFYKQLIPFIPKAFQELEVSGFIKSKRLK